MPEAFKNNFNEDVIAHLARQIKRHYPQFDEQLFLAKANHQLSKLELKQRSDQICQALLDTLPSDFSVASKIIENSLDKVTSEETILFENTNKGHRVEDESGIAGWIMMPVCEYVTKAALHNINGAQAPEFRLGLNLLKECTKRFSAEFAIRPFLRDFPNETLAVFYEWVNDENVHVRRLVSEGCRPLLPWGMRLHGFVEQPDLILPLLTKLRDDDAEYVRRSVANNLNDIAKHHPNKVAKIAADWWQPNNKIRIKLIKHACRTLLKKGHVGALELFGYPQAKLSALSLQLDGSTFAVGDSLAMTVLMSNQQKKAQRILIDYIVHHQKANGSMSPKVFKWTSLLLQPNEQRTLQKKHSFKPVTTRKYYTGMHKIELLINGEVFCEQVFELKE